VRVLDADDQNPAFYFDKYAAQIPAETGQGVKLQVKVITVPNLKHNPVNPAECTVNGMELHTEK
jgi:hypothetical protein